MLVLTELLLPNQCVFPVWARVCWGGFWGVCSMLPVFPTLRKILASPHRPKVYGLWGTQSWFLFFAQTWHLWWKRAIFHQRGQIWGFSTKSLHYFNFPFKLLWRRYGQNYWVIFCAHAENRHWWHPIQTILHWLYSRSFYNWVVS